MKCTLCGKEFGPGSPSITSEDWLCATGALFSWLEPLPVTTEAAGSTPLIPALSSLSGAMTNPRSGDLWRCSCREPTQPLPLRASRTSASS